MAQAPGQGIGALARGFGSLGNPQKIGLLVAAAALVAVVAVAVIWARTPEFRVLYSNLSDRDGGEVIAALTQQNVPYRISEGASVILVPADQVYDLRLKLAAQGMPKGGAVGFELMETQRFGISQFAEQVNYQRALAGELARTIQAMAPVQAARVHLAIPRPSVFVREHAVPSASVLVGLHPGRQLDIGQVSAIQHLVASSVPELSSRNVTVVDQSGSLLAGTGAADAGAGAVNLDASQLRYLRAVEDGYAQRIEAILAPIVGGAENVRAQVSATLDFSQSEQTSETYKPNQTPQQGSVRSAKTAETLTSNPGGPGGASRAPPNQPAAPVTHKESVVNYELDKTVSHVKNEVGAVKRLSAAVVVNFRREPDKAGGAVMKPLDEREMAQLDALARQAMGFSQERGDTLNVVNAPFSEEIVPEGPEAPSAWGGLMRALSGPAVLQALKYAVPALILLVVLLGLVRPTLRDLVRTGSGVRPPAAPLEEPLAAEGYAMPPQADLEVDLEAVRDLARQQPRVVANVVRNWVGRE